MKILTDPKIPLKVLLSYFKDKKNISLENTLDNNIEQLVKKYINGGFDDKFIESAIIEGKKILNSKIVSEEWIKKESGDFLSEKENITYRKFLESLLETLQIQFRLLQQRKNHYCFKDIFKISLKTKKFYDQKYKKISCLAQYFKYYYDDADNIKKLVLEKEDSEINKIKKELQNILQEKPFPYEWIANSLQRKITDIEENTVAEKYYNLIENILNQLNVASISSSLLQEEDS